MQRKLVKQGKGALTVSLPKKWLDLNNLKVGDLVEVNEEGSKVSISGKGTKINKIKQINLDKTNNLHLRSLIASAYKRGYDEIIIKIKEDSDLSIINEVINSFTGLEIISSNNKRYVIKSFLKDEGDNIENLIIKMFQLTKHIAEKTYNEREKVDLNNLKILLRPNTIKLRDHCLRLIHSNKFEGDKSYDYYEFVTILDKLAYSFYNYACDVVKYNIKKSELDNFIFNNLENIYRSYLRKDFNNSNKIWVETVNYYYNELQKDLKKNLKKEKMIMAMHYGHIVELQIQLNSRLLGCFA
ncbi:phosphate uptake regulator PhoU [archaeon]|jgi:hypothetical protein|nr:phosphate uptake regulator PhoU [archaeon]MBT3451457.1 phosphate uptake regulator PhoU [archaeon]MBT6868549.1 phosphate uptake regulator PhoU [archaeon]MBT7193083.1 phosphate uptake regulator PhoU [archaeon]MBT7381172.1 phosphate uptake regulator PhoU [archaeon]